MSQLSDEIIIEKVKNGNKDAYAHLVHRYQQKVFQTCIGFLHDKDDADDLTQEIFIKVYHNLNAFRKDAKFSTWLYRISINMAMNALRKKKIRKTFLSELSYKSGQQLKSNEFADDLIKQGEKKLFASRALDQLSPKQRKVFVLSYYREMSNQEVSEILNISLKAVESLLYRGRQRLQTLLKNRKEDFRNDL